MHSRQSGPVRIGSSVWEHLRSQFGEKSRLAAIRGSRRAKQASRSRRRGTLAGSSRANILGWLKNKPAERPESVEH